MTPHRTERLHFKEFDNDYIEHEDRFILNIAIIIFMVIIGLVSLILYLSFPSSDVLHDNSLEALTSTNEAVDRQTLKQTLMLRKMERKISELDGKLNTFCSIAKKLNMYSSVIMQKCDK